MYPKLASAITNADELVITKTLIKDKFKIRWDNMVKSLKESASSTWAAPVLLAILLGYNVYSNQEANKKIDSYAIQAQQNHDMLVRLNTLKEVEDKEKIKELEQIQRQKEIDDQYKVKFGAEILAMKEIILKR